MALRESSNFIFQEMIVGPTMNVFQHEYYFPTSYVVAMEVFYAKGSHINQTMYFNDVGASQESRSYDPNLKWQEQDVPTTNLFYFSYVFCSPRWFQLRLPYRNDAKIAKICNLWTFVGF